MKLVNDMRMLGGAFVKYWLGKVDSGTPLGNNGFLEMFDLGLFFFFSFLVLSKILGSSLLLFKEPGRRGSDRSFHSTRGKKEWDSRKSSLAACGTALMRRFPKTHGLALKTAERKRLPES